MKKQLPKSFLKTLEKVNALSLREKVLGFCVLFCCFFLVWKGILLNPLWDAKKQTEKQIGLAKKETAHFEAELEEVKQKAAQEHIRSLEQQVLVLKKEVASAEVRVKKAANKLIPPNEMADMLKKILEKNDDLKVVKLENIPEVALFADQKNQQANRFQMYKHGLAIELEGSFFAINTFIQHIENLKWRVLWDEMQYVVQKYPIAQVKIKLYTLSLNKEWISG